MHDVCWTNQVSNTLVCPIKKEDQLAPWLELERAPNDFQKWSDFFHKKAIQHHLVRLVNAKNHIQIPRLNWLNGPWQPDVVRLSTGIVANCSTKSLSAIFSRLSRLWNFHCKRCSGSKQQAVATLISFSVNYDARSTRYLLGEQWLCLNFSTEKQEFIQRCDSSVKKPKSCTTDL